jgi:RimJ/RimL family protein N-acetyltransferase
MGDHLDSAAVLETPRLRLTPVGEADAAELAVALADERLHEYIGGRPLTEPELRAQYRRWAAGPPDPAETWLNWVVRLRDTGAAAGTVQATVRPDAGPAADVAWVIGVPWQGRGLAGEAAGALAAWLGDGGVTVLRACIYPGHRASERVAERLGLAPTGELADGERVWAGPAPAA